MSTASLRPFAHLPSAADAIRQFTPNWFAANMGTGVVALVLGHFDGVPLLYQTGEVLWALNALGFCIFASLFALRWLLHYEGARQIMAHPVMSMSLGCIPMALATIANGFVVFGPIHLGSMAYGIAHYLWWLEAGLAVSVGLLVPMFMFTRQVHSPAQMTGVWLLPVVAAEVTAISGALLLPHLPHLPQAEQAGVLLSCLVLWSCSVPLALGMVAVLFIRMILHKLPDVGTAASCWLALGPIATGALGMMLFSQGAATALAGTPLAASGEVIGAVFLVMGVLLWGYGLWWVGLAALITTRYFMAHVPFNLGWWAYVFPTGVFTLATLELGAMWDSMALGLLGGAMALAVGVVWLLVSLRTMLGFWRGSLFHAPCLVPAE